MACNAWNHSVHCSCGFGGDTESDNGVSYSQEALPCATGRTWVLGSYLNPNARCPICGQRVYFYRSPHDGRVFFDDLAPDWPKHPCTDKSDDPPGSAQYISWDHIEASEAEWSKKGWEPFDNARAYPDDESTRFIGRFEGKLLELSLLRPSSADRDGPVLLRSCSGLSDFFEISFLKSDHFGTRSIQELSFPRRFAPVGLAVLRRVVDGDADAHATFARFILYDLADPIAARPHLEQAFNAGVRDVIFDLAVMIILTSGD